MIAIRVRTLVGLAIGTTIGVMIGVFLFDETPAGAVGRILQTLLTLLLVWALGTEVKDGTE